MPIYFYSQTGKFKELSNFAPFGVELDGKWWPTVEHYFQAQKFTDDRYQERIRLVNSPKDAKRLGRTRELPLRPDWEAVRDEIMRVAAEKKFRTHESARAVLLATGDEELVQAAP